MNEHELTESSRVILMSSAVEYASRLVAVPSVSVNSNAAVSAVVESFLKELGFQTEVQEFLDPFGVTKINVVGKLGAGTGGMAYFGHTDVVPVDSWSVTAHGPFEPTVRDDRLYGRGSCDMKGSVACMLAAAGRLRDKPLKQPLYIVCTADEEVGFHGARHLVENSPLYREIVHGQSRSIVGEPTELGVVHAHKGIAVFRAVSRGRAAHSSTREGTNANLAMIPFLAEMKQIHDETLTDPRWQHAEFDPPSICWNIGINDHTPAVNITAPQSICTVNFRHMPGQDANELVERARRAADKCGIEFHLESIGQPLYIDSKSDYVREVVEQVGATSSRTVGYGTDGSQFTELKQIVVLGPGSIRQAHTDDEWISLEQLQRGTDVYERLARRWCQQ